MGLPELFYKEVVGAVSCPPSLCVGFSLSPAKTVPGLEFFRLDGGRFADRKLLREVLMSENRRRYVFVIISRRLDFRLGTCGEARRGRIAGIYGGQDAAARRGGVLWGENINGYRYSAVAFRRACSSVLCVFLLSVGGVEFPRRCLRVGRVCMFSFCRQTARGSLGGSDGRQWVLFVGSCELRGVIFGSSGKLQGGGGVVPVRVKEFRLSVPTGDNGRSASKDPNM